MGFGQSTSDLVAATSDPDPDVRQCGVRALGLLETPAACDLLIKLLNHTEENLKTGIASERIIERLSQPAFARQLWRYIATHQPLSDQQNSAGDAQAIGVLRALANGDSHGPAVDLVPWLVDGSRNERVAALRVISRCCTTVPSEVIDCISDDDVVVAAQSASVLAARAVTSTQQASAIPALTMQLHSPDWWVRLHSARALATMGPAGHAVLREASIGDDPYAAERAVEELALATALSRKRRHQ